MTEQPADFNLKNYLPVLATAYGEGADQPYEAKRHILSTILNRTESGKAEFGADTGRVTDVLQKGYYAYSQRSKKYQEAVDQKFPDKASEDSFKEYQAILSGILRGKLKKSDALFFLTPKEVERIKKTKSMNMDLLEKVDQPGDHIFYKYKTQLPGKGKISKRSK